MTEGCLAWRLECLWLIWYILKHSQCVSIRKGLLPCVQSNKSSSPPPPGWRERTKTLLWRQVRDARRTGWGKKSRHFVLIVWDMKCNISGAVGRYLLRRLARTKGNFLEPWKVYFQSWTLITLPDFKTLKSPLYTGLGLTKFHKFDRVHLRFVISSPVVKMWSNCFGKNFEHPHLVAVSLSSIPVVPKNSLRKVPKVAQWSGGWSQTEQTERNWKSWLSLILCIKSTTWMESANEPFSYSCTNVF